MLSREFRLLSQYLKLDVGLDNFPLIVAAAIDLVHSFIDLLLHFYREVVLREDLMQTLFDLLAI